MGYPGLPQLGVGKRIDLRYIAALDDELSGTQMPPQIGVRRSSRRECKQTREHKENKCPLNCELLPHDGQNHSVFTGKR